MSAPNPFEPLPVATTAPRVAWRPIATMLGAQLVGWLGAMVLNMLTCGILALLVWVAPFGAALLWGAWSGWRGLTPRESLVPGVVGGLAVAVVNSVLFALAYTLVSPTEVQELGGPAILAALGCGQLVLLCGESAVGALLGVVSGGALKRAL